MKRASAPGLLFLLAATFAGCAPLLPHRGDPLCKGLVPGELDRLQISEGDRRRVCELVTRRRGYELVYVARIHEDLYDFPMLEVHMVAKAEFEPSSGPVFFYWKKGGLWSELGDVSTWDEAR